MKKFPFSIKSPNTIFRSKRQALDFVETFRYGDEKLKKDDELATNKKQKQQETEAKEIKEVKENHQDQQQDLNQINGFFFNSIQSDPKLKKIIISQHMTKSSIQFENVVKIHYLENTIGFSNFIFQLKKCSKLVIAYQSSGNGKEFYSLLGSKNIESINLNEKVQKLIFLVDDLLFEVSIYENDIKIQFHLNLIRNIFERKLIGLETQIICFHTQYLLRLLESETKTPFLHSFEKPILDPLIGAWLWDPELGLDEIKNNNVCNFEFPNLWRLLYSKEQLNVSNYSFKTMYSHIFKCKDLVLLLWQYLEQLKLWPCFIFEMRISCILAHMEVNGIEVDSNSIIKPKQAIQLKLEEISNQTKILIGKNINLNSPKQVSDNLASFNDDNYMFKKSLSGKHFSTSEQSIVKIKNDLEKKSQKNCPKFKFCNIVLDHRHYQKSLGFFNSISSRIICDLNSDRIHSCWIQYNTSTGRISSMNPNLQQQPKEAEFDEHTKLNDDFSPSNLIEKSSSNLTFSSSSSNLSNNSSLLYESQSYTYESELETDFYSQENYIDIKINIRDSFVSKNGYTLISADYNQIEMRVLAQISNDESLIQFFKSGQDIHKQVASKVFNIKIEEVTKQKREWCKRIVYGLVYGMGSNALAQSLNVTKEKAESFIKTFMSSFPKLEQWLLKTKKNALSEREVRTLLYRRRIFPQKLNFDLNKIQRRAINTIIQGTSADIIKLAMLKIDELICSESIDSNLVLQIHDELVYEVKDDQLEKMKEIMKNSMENEVVPHFIVPLIVHFKIGNRWGSMK